MADLSTTNTDKISLTLSTAEVIIDQYRIYLRLEKSSLVKIEAEHQQTKQIYKRENIDQKQIESLTNGFCGTINDLFDLIQDISSQPTYTSSKSSSNDQQVRKTLNIDDNNDQLHLTFKITIGLGKRSARSWTFVIELEKIQMNDTMRHERIIADLCRRIEYLEDRFVPPLGHIRSLSNATFCAPNHSNPTMQLSNNDQTCTVTNYQVQQEMFSQAANSELRVDQTFQSTTQNAKLKITFICTGGSINTICIGVMDEMSVNKSTFSWGTNTNTVSYVTNTNAWYLQLQDGGCYQGGLKKTSFPSPVMLNQRVTIVVDIQKKRVAFVVDDDCDTWTFKLPQDIDMSKLRPFIAMQQFGNTITIVDE